MASDVICLRCGNTHNRNTNCEATCKDKSIPSDKRNAQCVVCSDWFHKDGIYNHLRSCAKKLLADNARLRKAIEKHKDSNERWLGRDLELYKTLEKSNW